MIENVDKIAEFYLRNWRLKAKTPSVITRHFSFNLTLNPCDAHPSGAQGAMERQVMAHRADVSLLSLPGFPQRLGQDAAKLQPR
jgi:hypothetical protein